MVLCAACGEHNPVRARFCLTCGTPFAGEVPNAQAREVRKVVTVVFCDLTGSTELGERLDAESLRNLLDLYFTTMSDVLHRHGGTVEKFIGDAVVAVFGVPVVHEDDALRAVRAAMEMTNAMRDLTVEISRLWGVDPTIRVGVNTGEVLAGDAAGRERLATGDAVNVAARLEQAARPGQVVLGPETYRLVRDAVLVEMLQPMSLKGKSQPVSPYLVREVLAGVEGHSRRLDLPLVGRMRELDIIRRSYEEAVRTGTCRRSLVLGPAGIGKSRLVGEFLQTLEGRATVMSGPCLPYGRGITFWPVREMLREASGWIPGDSAERAQGRLAELLGGDADSTLVAENLAALVGVGPAAGRIEEGFWAVRRLLESLSRWRPVVVIVDDVHWAEPALLDLLDDIRRARGPIFVLCAARPELFEDHPGWAAEATRVVLDPLPGEVCDRLIDTLLGSSVVPSSVREHVRAAAEGNPLFVEEMLAMLREEGVLVAGPSGWTATRQLTPQMVPSSIQALLRARLDLLTLDEQACMQMGAVIGRVFWQSAVAELAGEVKADRATPCLNALESRDLITRDLSTFFEDHAYRFRHILLRDAAYASLPKLVRAAAHERFCSWLEGVVGDRSAEYDEIIGYHLERALELRSGLAIAGHDEEALALAAGARLEAAGMRAFMRGDTAAAVNLLGRAHRLLEHDPPARLHLVPTLSQAMQWRGDHQGARDLLGTSLVESARLQEPRVTMSLQLTRAAFRDGEDAPDVQIQTGLEAVDVFTEAGDDEGLARAWMLVGLAQLERGRTALAEEAWTQALAPASRADPALAEETEMWLSGYCMYGPTHVAEVAARLDAIGKKVGGKPFREGTLLRGRAFVAATRNEFAKAYRLLARSRETYADLGLSYAGALVSQTSYEVALRAGALEGVVAELRGDEQALDRMGEAWARSTTVSMLAHALHDSGRFPEAAEAVELGRRLTAPGDVFSQVLWRTASAKLLAGAGRHDEAMALVKEAVELLADSDWLCIRADALLDQARILELADHQEEAVSAAQDALDLYVLKGDEASAARARRHLAQLGS